MQDRVRYQEDGRVVIARPAFERWTGLGLALLLLPVGTILVVAVLGSPGGAVNPAERWGQWGMLGIGMSAVFGLGLFGLAISGPDRLEIDPKSRTYRHRRGLPLLARLDEGDLDDFAGLFVRPVVGQPNRGVAAYRLVLAPRREDRANVLLGGDLDEEAANARLSRLATETRLPIDPAIASDARHEARKARSVRLWGWIAAVGFALFGSGLLLQSIPALLADRAIDARGVVAPGTVRSVSRGRTSTVSYDFGVGNQKIRGQTTIDGHFAEILSPGDPIEVRYLPEDPRFNRSERSIGKRMGYFLGVFGLIVFGMGLEIGRRPAKHLDMNRFEA